MRAGEYVAAYRLRSQAVAPETVVAEDETADAVTSPDASKELISSVINGGEAPISGSIFDVDLCSLYTVVCYASI